MLVYLGTDLLAAWGLNLEFGVAGVVNFAYIVLVAAGAYLYPGFTLRPPAPLGGVPPYVIRPPLPGVGGGAGGPPLFGALRCPVWGPRAEKARAAPPRVGD